MSDLNLFEQNHMRLFARGFVQTPNCMLRVFVWLCCVLFVTVTQAFPDETSCLTRHCLAIVDAGSTGSRLHIYAYDLDNTQTPIQIEEIGSNKITPGLASIQPTQNNIEAYVEKLFVSLPNARMPVYFYATGGMRLISTWKQNVYYKAIRDWFLVQERWTLVDIKTISGQMEGVFGWLAENYDTGSLQSDAIPLAGVMDMGGASVQISFPVEQINAIDRNDIIQLDVYDRHIQLFSHSFLGLGQTEVSHQYFNAEQCFPDGYPLPNYSVGKGDVGRCQQTISELINTVQHVNQIILPAIKDNPVSSWYAMSGLSSLVNSKPFEFEQHMFTSKMLSEQADRELCHQSWDILNTQFPEHEYVFLNCLTASYYYGLIVNGYGLQPDQPIHSLAGQIASDWTKGVVIYQKTLSTS